MVHFLLSKTEQAYLSDKEQFSKTKQRYLRYRIRKKLKSRDAAATSRDSPNDLLVSLGRNNLIREALPKEEERPSSSAWQSEGFVIPRSFR